MSYADHGTLLGSLCRDTWAGKVTASGAILPRDGKRTYRLAKWADDIVTAAGRTWLWWH